MIMMKCMACHAKISMPDGLATCETTCPKCRMRTLVGLETSGGRRLRAIEVSRIIISLSKYEICHGSDKRNGVVSSIRPIDPRSSFLFVLCLDVSLHRVFLELHLARQIGSIRY